MKSVDLLAFVVLLLTSQAALCAINECLIQVADHNGGLTVTTALRDGHTQQHHGFPDLHLSCTQINYMCQELKVFDPFSEENTTGVFAVAMVENGILLLQFTYNDSQSPALRLLNNLTLDFECVPLALLQNSFHESDYLIACVTADLGFQLRHLTIDKDNIADSSTKNFFRTGGNIFAGGNFSLLSNIIVRPDNEDRMYFAYGSTVFEVQLDLHRVVPVGPLDDPDQFICEYARRIVFSKTDGNIIHAQCPNVLVDFSLSSESWLNAVLYGTVPLDLLCPGDNAILTANSTVNYHNRDVQLPTVYEGHGQCIGELDRHYLVYEAATDSAVWLVDLAKGTSGKLTNLPCGSADEIFKLFEGFIIDNRYVVVSELTNQNCITKLFDSNSTIIMPLITSTGHYSTVGVVDWLMQTRPSSGTHVPFNTKLLIIIIPAALILALIFIVALVIVVIVKNRRSDHGPSRDNSNIITGNPINELVQLQSVTPDVSQSRPKAVSPPGATDHNLMQTTSFTSNAGPPPQPLLTTPTNAVTGQTSSALVMSQTATVSYVDSDNVPLATAEGDVSLLPNRPEGKQIDYGTNDQVCDTVSFTESSPHPNEMHIVQSNSQTTPQRPLARDT